MKKKIISILLMTFVIPTLGGSKYYIEPKADTILNESENYLSPMYATISADKPSPQISGTSIKITANFYGTNDVKYKFLIKDSKGNWYKLRDYSPSNTYVWKTSVAGDKTIYVDCKTSSGYVVREFLNYTIEDFKKLNISSFTADKLSPQISGTKVTLSANANGGNGELQYKFLIKDSSGNWYKLRDYAPLNSIVWTTGAVGDKTLYVDVKDASGQTVRKEMKYTVKEKAPNLSITNFNVDKPSPQPQGTDIKLTSNAVGSGELQYKFLMRDSKGVWSIIKDFSKDNSVIWTPETTGNVTLYVDVKDSTGKKVRKEMNYLVEEKIDIENLTCEDLNIPLEGFPISLVRSYNRENQSKGDFGNGWTLSLSNLKLDVTNNMGQDWYQEQVKSGVFYVYTIKETKEHKVTVTYPKERVEEFSVALSPNSQRLQPITYVEMSFNNKNNSNTTLKSLDNTSFNTAGLGDIVLMDSTGDCELNRFEYSDENGIKFTLNKTKGIEKILYPNGDSIIMNEDEIVYTCAKDNTSKKVEIKRDSTGKITSIIDLEGKAIKYEYDSKDNLIKVIDRDGRETNYSSIY